MSNDSTAGIPRSAYGLAIGAVIAAAIAVRLFPAALPQIALRQEMTRERAIAMAGTFVRAHALAPASARTAVRFQSNDSLRTYLELAAGGQQAVNALASGADVAVFTWAVRFFVSQDPHEATVRFAPDGRLTGFVRKVAESDKRPPLDSAAARALADTTITRWTGRDLSRYQLRSASYETRPASGRVDRTFTYDRADKTIGGAPVRLEVVIAGDLPSSLREFVVIPESFARRYAEMRSMNDLLALIAQIALPVYFVAGVIALIVFARRRVVRWRPAATMACVMGLVMAASLLNDLPGSWFDYDTATSAATFRAQGLAQAIGGAALFAAAMTVIIAAAEVVTRRAFPEHLDWWRLWHYRGTREVAGRVFGAYGLALFGFAYVAVFYVVVRKYFGWWVPSELLDDPNQIATPLPWVGGLALAMQAGVLEESLFRAIPLALLSLWVGDRPYRRVVMTTGVIVTALAFGFAHANYPSWPPYSRGVELVLEASLWALIYLRYGLPVTIITHFVFDLTLFGLFAGASSALPYRITLAIVATLAALPALVVLWSWVRQRGLQVAGHDARFAMWEAPAVEHAPARAVVVRAGGLSRASRRAAWIAIVLGCVGIAASPTRTPLGPPFTATRSRALATADSALRGRGVRPDGWTHLSTVESYTGGPRQRFLREHDARALALALATSYQPAAAWSVRYVRTTGGTAARAEEWRVRLLPDGRLLEVEHVLPQDAPGATLDAAATRAVARRAIAAAGLDTLRLAEVKLEQTPRPHRRDAVVEYADTTVKMPASASARVQVTVAGDEATLVRRYLELPEAFQRADQADQDRRRTAAVISALVLVAVTVAALILVLRRPAIDDGAIAPPRALGIAIGALAIVQVARTYNARPSQLFAYVTAMPWSTFLATIDIVTGLSAFLALVVAGVWMLANGVRQRLGVPLWPSGPTSSRDTLLAGAALGLLPAIAGGFTQMALARRELAGPTTVLDRLVPVATGALSVVPAAALLAACAPLAAMLVVAFSPGRVRRAAVLVVLSALLAPLVAASSPGSPMGLVEAGVATIVALAIAAIAVAAWGGASAAVWVVAALAATVAQQAQSAATAGSNADAASGALGAVLAVALLVGLYRQLRSRERTS